MNVLCRYNYCRILLCRGTTDMFIVGTDENITAVSVLYDYLRTAFRRPAEESRETALACCHDTLIDKYLEKIGAGTSKAHPRKTGTDRSAYYSSMGDGRTISLNRQIKGGGI